MNRAARGVHSCLIAEEEHRVREEALLERLTMSRAGDAHSEEETDG
jgi:hypothetical protein